MQPSLEPKLITELRDPLGVEAEEGLFHLST